jgi:hypothetical protein
MAAFRRSIPQAATPSPKVAPAVSMGLTPTRPDAPTRPGEGDFRRLFAGLQRADTTGVVLASSWTTVDAGRVRPSTMAPEAARITRPMKLKITRRHLLKGSLAAPLVLTVRSAAGTGTAMTSAGACRIRDKDRYEDGNVYKFQKYKDADEWLRKEVQICKLEKKDSWGRYQEISGEYFKGDTGCWWQMVKNGEDCSVYQKSDYTDSNCRIYQNVRKEYGLVCVDDYGQVKGFAWEKKEHPPITGSCWASLKLT